MGSGVLLALLALLALLDTWGVTLRLALLMLLPITAMILIVAVIAIYLGPVGVGALLTTAAGGYGVRRHLTQGRGARPPRQP